MTDIPEMHELIGFIVNDAARLPCLLYRYHDDAWLHRADEIHGWGAGYYMGENALLRVQPGSVCEDVSLYDLAGDEGTKVLVAHTSLSVPIRDIKDIQPFRWRQWLFAHTGALDLGDRREEMLSALPRYLQRSRKGKMDGEILFLHFIDELCRGQLIDHRARPEDIAICLRKVVEVAGVSINILVTDGHVLLAYRSAGPFVYSLFEGIMKCELCKVDDAHMGFTPTLKSHQQFKGICVTSRPFGTSEKWEEIPERQVLVVRPSLDFEIIPVPE